MGRWHQNLHALAHTDQVWLLAVMALGSIGCLLIGWWFDRRGRRLQAEWTKDPWGRFGELVAYQVLMILLLVVGGGLAIMPLMWLYAYLTHA
jgi:hypothetical protein